MEKNKMIYLVEDDESIRELVIYTLKSQGFEAKGFERPSLFWKALEKEQPVLLLLDVMFKLLKMSQKKLKRLTYVLEQMRNPKQLRQQKNIL